jgi:hypothetical protein
MVPMGFVQVVQIRRQRYIRPQPKLEGLTMQIKFTHQEAR